MYFENGACVFLYFNILMPNLYVKPKYEEGFWFSDYELEFLFMYLCSCPVYHTSTIVHTVPVLYQYIIYTHTCTFTCTVPVVSIQIPLATSLVQFYYYYSTSVRYS